MKVISMAALLTLLPAALMAQQDSTSQTSTRIESRTSIQLTARAERGDTASRSFSSETRAQLDATLRIARERDLPEEPIRDRIAEGQARGASEAQTVIATRKLMARLDAAQNAMVRAGREEPSSQEVESGATAMESGATSAQIEALAESAASERSLVVAFDVLASLVASGRPVASALAQIQGRLESGASDASIASLTAGLTGNLVAGGPGSGSSAAGEPNRGVAGNGTVSGIVGSTAASVGAAVSAAARIIRP